MRLPPQLKITGNIDDIYWKLNNFSECSLAERKQSRTFGCIAVLLGISLFTVIPYIFSSSPEEDASYRLGVYIVIFVIAFILFIAALAKNKFGFEEKKLLLDMIQGIIEGIRDDVRKKGTMRLFCEFIPGRKPVESDQSTTEPRFYSVRRIKYKYKTADLRFNLLDGNILKVRIYTKEREKIKRDHSTKKYYRKKYLLKVRLDVNPICYDLANFNDSIYNNYEVTPNIVIAGVKKGQNHISMIAKLAKLDQYTGRQLAGMVKGLYAGIKLKKFVSS
ncbi:MAG TPA: hypothetical protein PL110_00270 [Candidatus Eremiobacteraeota bacterium]|nr:MAG: hypothetical protein BWY64_00098 [bacterium ADurb.Bin363]HPZ06520.1 hypothetical protein [Candidatus Eremiobacteraeota bacterium]